MLAVVMDAMTDEMSEYENDVKLFEAVFLERSDTGGILSPGQISYRIRLVKDALIGKLVIKVDPNNKAYLPRSEFML